MDQRTAELEAENKLLRTKLSPLENPEFTTKLREAMDEHLNFYDYTRMFRGDEYFVLDALTVWAQCFGTEPNNRQLTDVGRSLQALLWERSALQGYTVFVKKVSEYEEFGY